jgi:hypothetical protein
MAAPGDPQIDPDLVLDDTDIIPVTSGETMTTILPDG